MAAGGPDEICQAVRDRRGRAQPRYRTSVGRFKGASVAAAAEGRAWSTWQVTAQSFWSEMLTGIVSEPTRKARKDREGATNGRAVRRAYT